VKSDQNGAYLRDIVLILKNQWPRKHTENTEYSPIISVSSVDSVDSVDSVAIYHDFDLTKCHSDQGSDSSMVPLIMTLTSLSPASTATRDSACIVVASLATG